MSIEMIAIEQPHQWCAIFDCFPSARWRRRCWTTATAPTASPTRHSSRGSTRCGSASKRDTWRYAEPPPPPLHIAVTNHWFLGIITITYSNKIYHFNNNNHEQQQSLWLLLFLLWEVRCREDVCNRTKPVLIKVVLSQAGGHAPSRVLAPPSGTALFLCP